MFASLVLIFLTTVISGKFAIDFSKSGVEGMQDFWEEYKSLIEVFGGTLTLFVVSYNLMKFMDTETTKALGDLRNRLNSGDNRRLHAFLLDEGEREIISNDFKNILAGPILSTSDLYITVDSPKNPEKQAAEISNLIIFDYLGTIELGAIMLKRGLISFDEFYNQVGYRIENVVNNNDIKVHVKENRPYYDMLYYVIDIMIEKGKLPENCLM